MSDSAGAAPLTPQLVNNVAARPPTPSRLKQLSTDSPTLARLRPTQAAAVFPHATSQPRIPPLAPLVSAASLFEDVAHSQAASVDLKEPYLSFLFAPGPSAVRRVPPKPAVIDLADPFVAHLVAPTELPPSSPRPFDPEAPYGRTPAGRPRRPISVDVMREDSPMEVDEDAPGGGDGDSGTVAVARMGGLPGAAPADHVIQHWVEPAPETNDATHSERSALSAPREMQRAFTDLSDYRDAADPEPPHERDASTPIVLVKSTMLSMNVRRESVDSDNVDARGRARDVFSPAPTPPVRSGPAKVQQRDQSGGPSRDAACRATTLFSSNGYDSDDEITAGATPLYGSSIPTTTRRPFIAESTPFMESPPPTASASEAQSAIEVIDLSMEEDDCSATGTSKSTSTHGASGRRFSLSSPAPPQRTPASGRRVAKPVREATASHGGSSPRRSSRRIASNSPRTSRSPLPRLPRIPSSLPFASFSDSAPLGPNPPQLSGLTWEDESVDESGDVREDGVDVFDSHVEVAYGEREWQKVSASSFLDQNGGERRRRSASARPEEEHASRSESLQRDIVRDRCPRAESDDVILVEDNDVQESTRALFSASNGTSKSASVKSTGLRPRARRPRTSTAPDMASVVYTVEVREEQQVRDKTPEVRPAESPRRQESIARSPSADDACPSPLRTSPRREPLPSPARASSLSAFFFDDSNSPPTLAVRRSARVSRDPTPTIPNPTPLSSCHRPSDIVSPVSEYDLDQTFADTGDDGEKDDTPPRRRSRRVLDEADDDDDGEEPQISPPGRARGTKRRRSSAVKSSVVESEEESEEPVRGLVKRRRTSTSSRNRRVSGGESSEEAEEQVEKPPPRPRTRQIGNNTFIRDAGSQRPVNDRYGSTCAESDNDDDDEVDAEVEEQVDEDDQDMEDVPAPSRRPSRRLDADDFELEPERILDYRLRSFTPVDKFAALRASRERKAAAATAGTPSNPIAMYLEREDDDAGT
ncbi:hypothetical protein BDK51DRAFT_36848, partial [Blyttiomyces helicus]